MRTSCCDGVFTQNGDHYGEWRTRTGHYHKTRGVRPGNWKDMTKRNIT